MRTKSIAIIVAIAFLPVAGFTQAPPNPPNPPAPPGPPNPPDRHEKMPKVPVTFLGVETSPVPPVVSEQLGLPKGFGLVVDYVVPDGPAAAAGVQQNDILKMLNDQILMEPRQLEKLVRSYAEGTNVTLTVLRKGKEEKVTVKLTKKELPQRREFGPRGHRHSDFPFGDQEFGELRDRLNDLKEQFGDVNQGMIHDAVMKAHEEATRARAEGRRVSERALDEARRAAEQVKITLTDDTGLKTTKIDIGKAQIVFSDEKGELRIETLDGKKVLTAKDPQGRLLFSGPVETKEDLDKIPAEVRERYEKLQERDLPSVVSSDGENDEDDDSSDMNDEDEGETPSMEQVSAAVFLHSIWMIHTVLI